jgi:hypothetical protein
MISSPPVIPEYHCTVILTVLDWPNDNLTFIAEDHRDNVNSMPDTTGSVEFPVENGKWMEVRYYDDHSFVARYYTNLHVYTPVVNITERGASLRI